MKRIGGSNKAYHQIEMEWRNNTNRGSCSWQRELNYHQIRSRIETPASGANGVVAPLPPSWRYPLSPCP